jgi:glutamate synthase (NADPH/NADH) small chain
MIKMKKVLLRPEMPEQDPQKRITNFDEVPLGYTEEMAQIEANRCLQCAEPKCIGGCPVNIDIPGFIKLIKEKEYRKSIEYMKEFNILPAICGRVCPQEVQCEQACILGKKKDPIAIGALERFIADWERINSLKACPDCRPPNNIKVAVIGSGPAGLTCAADLARKGYDVTIFEAFHEGGGVEYNKIIGKILTIEDLRNMEFKAFFIGVGAGLPIMLKMPGLNLNGVVTANEFLTRANLMKAYKFPEYDTPINIGKIITVVGGGNVALDSARVALRLGADKVIIVYRRSEEEMPARKAEYHHAQEEGIEFQFLTNPTEIIGDEYSNIQQLKAIKMKLGEPDDSGRRRPIPIENSDFFIPTDTVILAVGTRANPVLTKTLPDLKLNKYGYIETDESGRTNIEDIFAGGDIVTGSATVISAMGAGRKAAKAIDEYLTGL